MKLLGYWDIIMIIYKILLHYKDTKALDDNNNMYCTVDLV